MPVTSNISSLVNRMAQRRYNMSSGVLKPALTRIGIRVRNDTVINIRRQHLIDTGNLINSIRYEVFTEQNRAGVVVGSFGVPYAAAHEFGFHGNVSIRAYQRLMTKVFGNTVDPRKIAIGPHNRRMNIRARPYLRPAVRKNAKFISDTIREALNQ